MTTPQYPYDPEPYIWLQDEEDSGMADCGCMLVLSPLSSGPAFHFCTMHAAAPELLEALEGVLSIGRGLSVANEQCKARARALLRRIRRQTL